MSAEIIKVPDIGSESAEVVEILVAVGDQLEADQSLVVLESDKASLEVPCPIAGTVTAIKVKTGDQLSEGMDLVELEIEAGASEQNVEESVSEVAPQVDVADVQVAAASDSGFSSAETSETDNLYLVPDIGAEEAEIIEVMVAVGDEISEGDSIVVAESDKASLEVPAEASGTVVALHVKEGDKVQQDFDLITLRVTSDTPVAENADGAAGEAAGESISESAQPGIEQSAPEATAELLELLVPDMGSDSAEIIEIPVSIWDKVEEGDTLVIVETDKASVEVPAESAGEITAIHVEVGSTIAQGDKLVTLLSKTLDNAAIERSTEFVAAEEPKAKEAVERQPQTKARQQSSDAHSQPASVEVHAGPAVRKLARELGVDLDKVKPTGLRDRVLKDDIHAYVKQQLQSSKSTGSTGAGAGIPEIPPVDWSQFGEVNVQSMSRIHKLTAANMSRNWLNVPHVTQFDDADVTELETYRGYLKPEGIARGIKMTPLSFLLKASAVALKENPKFNTALHENGNDLVERKFFHVGVAVDTPMGLMVPVIRDVDQKDIWELAEEVSSLANKAKEGKLSPKEMQGASFTISSLGAIGGKGFTPIVPAPQAGILGVSKTSIQPVWDGHAFVPRNMMPLALSYDHRVVNGVDAGKFMTCLVAVLGDLSRIWNG